MIHWCLLAMQLVGALSANMCLSHPNKHGHALSPLKGSAPAAHSKLRGSDFCNQWYHRECGTLAVCEARALCQMHGIHAPVEQALQYYHHSWNSIDTKHCCPTLHNKVVVPARTAPAATGPLENCCAAWQSAVGKQCGSSLQAVQTNPSPSFSAHTNTTNMVAHGLRASCPSCPVSAGRSSRWCRSGCCCRRRHVLGLELCCLGQCLGHLDQLVVSEQPQAIIKREPAFLDLDLSGKQEKTREFMAAAHAIGVLM